MHVYPDWDQTVHFHGHICPGIAVGHRACWYARRLLNLDDGPIASSYYVVAENDLCGIDALQVNTGCTLGNDHLIIDHQGKQAFRFISKKSGQGVRLVLEAPLWQSDYPISLHHKINLGKADAQEAEEFLSLRRQRGEELLELADEELFKVESIQERIPGQPRLHPTVRCSRCHEQVMEPWAEYRNAEVFCPHCLK